MTWYVEWADDAHAADDNAHDKARSAEELPDRKAARIRAHGGESAENIWRTVPEREERYARDILLQPEHLRQRSKVRAEEVGCTDPERGEKEDEPHDKPGED